jgi:hypothetical protein
MAANVHQFPAPPLLTSSSSRSHLNSTATLTPSTTVNSGLGDEAENMELEEGEVDSEGTSDNGLAIKTTVNGECCQINRLQR